MTEKQPERQEDELDLDPETVEDLDVDTESADAVRGGPGASGRPACASA